MLEIRKWDTISILWHASASLHGNLNSRIPDANLIIYILMCGFLVQQSSLLLQVNNLPQNTIPAKHPWKIIPLHLSRQLPSSQQVLVVVE